MAHELPLFLQPTLDDEVCRLIAIHGRDAVKDAVRRLTAVRRGRPGIEADEKLFASVIKADAVEWVQGRDPFQMRRNRKIAREFAQKQPGHSAVSTIRRIHRKLSRHRRRAVLVAAYLLTGYSPSELAAAGFRVKNIPFTAHFEALEALSAEGEEYWRNILNSDRTILERYRKLRGEPPPGTSWREILDAPVQMGSVAAETLIAQRS